MAHAFGAAFHLPHGRVVGMFLPYSIEFTAGGGGTRYREIAGFLNLPAEDESQGTASLVKAVRELAGQLNQPFSIQEMGINEQVFETALPDLVANAVQDPQMVTVFRIPDEESLEQIFWCAYDGKTVDF